MNTPMTSREAFEKWHKSEYQGHNSHSYKHDTTAYIDDHVEIAFVAWEASQAQQASVIAELVEALELTSAICAGETLSKSMLIKALEKSQAILAKVKGK